MVATRAEPMAEDQMGGVAAHRTAMDTKAASEAVAGVVERPPVTPLAEMEATEALESAVVAAALTGNLSISEGPVGSEAETAAQQVRLSWVRMQDLPVGEGDWAAAFLLIPALLRCSELPCPKTRQPGELLEEISLEAMADADLEEACLERLGLCRSVNVG